MKRSAPVLDQDLITRLIARPRGEEPYVTLYLKSWGSAAERKAVLKNLIQEGDSAMKRVVISISLLGALLCSVVTGQTDEVVVFHFPVEAVDYMEAEGLTDGRIFNAYSWGGYLIWRDIQPFIDGRADLYGGEFMFLFQETEVRLLVM